MQSSQRSAHRQRVLSRRQFLVMTGRRGTGVALLAGGLPALLAACGADEQPPAAVEPTPVEPTPTPTPTQTPTPAEDGPAGQAIVGDVLEYALESDEWAGPFGFVTFRLHHGLVDGNDVYFIRTDGSDPDYAGEHGLVAVPKLAELAGTDLVGRLFLPENDDQPPILSSEPGRDDYTPAWQVHQLRWTGDPRELASVADVDAAEADGVLEIEDTGVVVNFPLVKWSTGELPVDDERTGYLGPGQLLEPPDTDELTVTFKLHECFPASRYIVADTDLQPMAEGMQVAHSPRLADTSEAGVTGRTNVFMNGIDGPGPMGFQPSVFDTQAGDPEWSPYWDHMTYAWADGVDPRVLTTEEELHGARDDGELEEFPGVPDTEGEIFVVNCPVPVIAENTFEA
ncbi:MAG: hypothetical protein GEU81_08290 [Nitriliruptorales bacterium]|nr:hypothetical protein [Nitriliruptorales bacterium]